MVAYRGWTAALMALAGLVLSGCGGAGTIYRKDTLGDLQTLSVDARQRLAFVGDYTDRHNRQLRALCLESSPEAAVAQAATLAASSERPLLNAAGAPSGAAAKTSFAGASAETLASLSLKTQTIQIFRDGYYRLCEGLLNGVITDVDYSYVLANLDSTMIALAAVDALGAPVNAAPAAIIGTGKLTVTGPDGKSVEVPASGTFQAVSGSGEFKGGEEARARAIRDIVMAAYAQSDARRRALDRHYLNGGGIRGN